MGTARQARTNTSWERCWKLEISPLLKDKMADQNSSNGAKVFHAWYINSYVYQRVHLQGNVYQGTVEVEIEFRLIEAIFFKIFTLSWSQFFNCTAVSKRNLARMMLLSDNSCKERTFVLSVSNLSESKSD